MEEMNIHKFIRCYLFISVWKGKTTKIPTQRNKEKEKLLKIIYIEGKRILCICISSYLHGFKVILNKQPGANIFYFHFFWFSKQPGSKIFTFYDTEYTSTQLKLP